MWQVILSCFGQTLDFQRFKPVFLKRSPSVKNMGASTFTRIPYTSLRLSPMRIDTISSATEADVTIKRDIAHLLITAQVTSGGAYTDFVNETISATLGSETLIREMTLQKATDLDALNNKGHKVPGYANILLGAVAVDGVIMRGGNIPRNGREIVLNFKGLTAANTYKVFAIPHVRKADFTQAFLNENFTDTVKEFKQDNRLAGRLPNGLLGWVAAAIQDTANLIAVTLRYSDGTENRLLLDELRGIMQTLNSTTRAPKLLAVDGSGVVSPVSSDWFFDNDGYLLLPDPQDLVSVVVETNGSAVELLTAQLL